MKMLYVNIYYGKVMHFWSSWNEWEEGDGYQLIPAFEYEGTVINAIQKLESRRDSASRKSEEYWTSLVHSAKETLELIRKEEYICVSKKFKLPHRE